MTKPLPSLGSRTSSPARRSPTKVCISIMVDRDES